VYYFGHDFDIRLDCETADPMNPKQFSDCFHAKQGIVA
jgi:hypothetical protein